MAALLEKVYPTFQVTFKRRNFQGDIYHVASPQYTDVVIIDGPLSSCTCHQTNCDHVREVKRIRGLLARQSERRAVQSALFDLYA